MMKATLSILTAERLEVMMGRPPVLVMPPLNKTVDAFRSPVTLTDDKLLILALVMKFWVPRAVSPPPIETVDAFRMPVTLTDDRLLMLAAVM